MYTTRKGNLTITLHTKYKPENETNYNPNCLHILLIDSAKEGNCFFNISISNSLSLALIILF